MPGNQRSIAPEVKQLILRMESQTEMSQREMRTLTGVTQRRLKKLFDRTGEVARQAFPAGRPRLLTSIDAMFLEGCIERQPDIYLSELRHALLTTRNVSVRKDVISRTLHRRGFTRKKVSACSLLLIRANETTYGRSRRYVKRPVAMCSTLYNILETIDGEQQLLMMCG
jgi:transposase